MARKKRRRPDELQGPTPIQAYAELGLSYGHTRASALRALADLQSDMQSALEQKDFRRAKAIWRYILDGCDPLDLVLDRARPDGDSPELDPIRRELVLFILREQVSEIQRDPYYLERPSEHRMRLVRETLDRKLGEAERMTGIPRRTLSRLRARLRAQVA